MLFVWCSIVFGAVNERTAAVRILQDTTLPKNVEVKVRLRPKVLNYDSLFQIQPNTIANRREEVRVKSYTAIKAKPKSSAPGPNQFQADSTDTKAASVPETKSAKDSLFYDDYEEERPETTYNPDSFAARTHSDFLYVGLVLTVAGLVCGIIFSRKAYLLAAAGLVFVAFAFLL